jgi:tRNA threonylcarbamoyladenosine biosynthesis protein TsaB
MHLMVAGGSHQSHYSSRRSVEGGSRFLTPQFASMESDSSPATPTSNSRVQDDRSGNGFPPGLTLVIESSTVRGSAAVFDGGELIASVEARLRDREAERLMPAVAEALSRAGVLATSLARVACGAGPGSFTGLRIGAAIAKGFAQAAGIPLHSVSSLLLAGASAALHSGDGLYLVALDAMRGESFTLAVESRSGVASAAGQVELRSTASLPEFARLHGMQLVGPAHADVWPDAAALRGCRSDALGDAVELSSWEPDYGRVAEAQAKWEREHGRPLAGA